MTEKIWVRKLNIYKFKAAIVTIQYLYVPNEVISCCMLLQPAALTEVLYGDLGLSMSRPIEISEKFRILKWSYCTIFQAIFGGDIALHSPYIYMVGTSNLGSWNGRWWMDFGDFLAEKHAMRKVRCMAFARVTHQHTLPLDSMGLRALPWWAQEELNGCTMLYCTPWRWYLFNTYTHIHM